jgi:nucleoside-diphosphate-sugar epimerase
MSKRILILGANGFIGSSLTQAILRLKDWEVFGMDVANHKLEECLGHDRFHFLEGDIQHHQDWIDHHVRKCDVVLPLVAIANPVQYVRDPLRVFELDFEANLAIIRQCVRHRKRIVFPSTSEVYGMAPDEELDEHTSPLVYGPIDRQRWIYACSKQLLDRIIYAHGVRDQIDYTLFRPFNWIGPKLDDVFDAKEGSSRLFTQFISNVLFRKPLQLVDGGSQSRSFTHIDDGVDALLRIIENKGGVATRQIFNLGNPANNITVRDLAYAIIEAFRQHPDYVDLANDAQVTVVRSEEYFGRYYQDIQRRVPSIRHAWNQLGWAPRIGLAEAIQRTLAYHLEQHRSVQQVIAAQLVAATVSVNAA